MSVHKVTDAAAKSVYTLLLMLLPADANAGSWALSKRLLKKVCESRVVKIDTCPNDCVAFIDCKHHKLRHYQHSHRSCCPTCGADRWLTRADGKKKSAKVVFHLPAGPWLRDLFRDSEVAPFLASDYEEQPQGHVTKSRGWHKKVCAHVKYLSILSKTHKILIQNQQFMYNPTIRLTHPKYPMIVMDSFGITYLS
jgi:hypothetical protein